MTKFRIAALGAALVLGVSSVAAAQPPAAGRPDRSNRPNREVGRDSVRARRLADRGPGRVMRGALLRDIQLTDAQKTQLRTVHEKYATERRTLMEKVRGNGRTDGQRVRPDSAARAQVRSQMQSLMERERGDVRGLLTAEQQRTFDRNVAEVRDRAGRHLDRAGKRPGRRAA